jgi:hypothetical protein
VVAAIFMIQKISVTSGTLLAEASDELPITGTVLSVMMAGPWFSLIDR